MFLTKDELYRLDEGNNKITPLQLPAMGTYENTDILPLEKQGVLISGTYNGIRKYDFHTADLTSKIDWKSYFRPDNDRPNIILMAQDGKGRVWFARYGKSYGYFVPGTSEVYYFDLEHR